jgi:alginate O-acetyltransferase complex protein AlgJ
MGDLRASDVEVIFGEMLGREPLADEVAAWMRTGSVRVLLDGVIASEEYAARVAQRATRAPPPPATGTFLNCWVAGWEQFARPAGEVSEDGVAIVGQHGHLFICGGSNDNVASYRGISGVAPGWAGAWRALVEERTEHARRAGRLLACLVVPEKLAVYEDVFPGDLTPLARRPVLTLIEDARLPILYPLEELRDARAGGETYLRTDSHLTLRGNTLMAGALLQGIGVSPTSLGDLTSTHSYLAPGDLGSHFDPPIVELMNSSAALSRASVIADNRAEVAAVGGHVGTVRVFRNEAAPDGRVAVIFGDSYAFGDDAYQGLSWFLAQVFREVHFVWVPFGWDPDYLEAAGADIVVCQTAERFAGRVPMARVDARAMARETVARRTALTEGRIFDDAPEGI